MSFPEVVHAFADPAAASNAWRPPTPSAPPATPAPLLTGIGVICAIFSPAPTNDAIAINQELADELNTNRTTLSAYINKELGTTFYDLINRVRLE